MIYGKLYKLGSSLKDASLEIALILERLVFLLQSKKLKMILKYWIREYNKYIKKYAKNLIGILIN
ncbi:hypothetical protein DXA39_08335 [Anaerococcus nagyae]|uniref:Uncharacterized protein n=1 Tax=Anaerococcus nagyae TaxID=1755241 RepID=A0A3E2TGW8_9FIRM|nr:hypothetical protein DXA39_08335 [Anaerococcus nagyae]